MDLTQIPRMRRAVLRWDERFLRRIFTDDELAYCRRRRDPIPHLAARFAAKEATLKALGTGLRMGVRWRELEVRAQGAGASPGARAGGRSGDPAAIGGDRLAGDRGPDLDETAAETMAKGFVIG